MFGPCWSSETDLGLILDEDDLLLGPGGVAVHVAGLGVALVVRGLISRLLPVLGPAPLHHPGPVLLAVQSPASLVQRVLLLSASLRGAAGGRARDLGRGRQLRCPAQPDVLTEPRVH